MKLECCTIIIIVGLLAISFLRRDRKEYALCSVPLLFLPFAHLTADLIGTYVTSSESVSYYLPPIVDGIAALVTIIALLLCCRALKSRKGRVYYTVCCSCYTAIIAVIFILYSL